MHSKSHLCGILIIDYACLRTQTHTQYQSKFNRLTYSSFILCKHFKTYLNDELSSFIFDLFYIFFFHELWRCNYACRAIGCIESGRKRNSILGVDSESLWIFLLFICFLRCILFKNLCWTITSHNINVILLRKFMKQSEFAVRSRI